MSTLNREGLMGKKMKRTAAFFAAVLGVAGIANAQSAPSRGFFDWGENTNPTAPNFTASPFLNNNNAAFVAQVLSESQALGKPLAVKVVEPLTNPAARNIFNQFPVQYVFCDFEEVDAVGRTRAVADLVVASSQSRNAFVGNFNFYPRAGNDGTRPGTVNAGPGDISFQNRPFNAQYPDSRGKTSTRTGKLMSNQALYPGSPDYKNPAAGNSDAPNIRSALFTLPIIRQTLAENGLRGDGHAARGDLNIPWVTRFNNWANQSLDTDGDPSNGYQFEQFAANPSQGQLLSRGDFQAQVLHYRLRGADSVMLFQASAGSVVGYSQTDEQNDIRSGWGQSSVVNAVFSRSHQLANLTTVVGDRGGTTGDAGARGLSQAGAVWSGVYDSNKNQSNRRLAILISNLTDGTKTIDMPNKVGGFRTFSGASVPNDDDYVMAAGTHRLLTFTLRNGAWRLDTNNLVFTDSDRNGVGIPEPATAGLLGLGALGLLARRRRHA